MSLNSELFTPCGSLLHAFVVESLHEVDYAPRAQVRCASAVPVGVNDVFRSNAVPRTCEGCFVTVRVKEGDTKVTPFSGTLLDAGEAREECAQGACTVGLTLNWT